MIKYVVWGIGLRGKWVIDILGNERVVAIVEGNTERVGTSYNNIPIISFEQYIEMYKKYPVIITPKSAEQQIKEVLNQEKEVISFTYSDNYKEVVALLWQAPLEQLLSQYKREEYIAIYGLSWLALVLYDYLNSQGYQIKLLLEETEVNKCNILAFQKVEVESVTKCDWNKFDRILLAKDISLHTQVEQTVENYFDLYYRNNLCYCDDIMRFKNVHKNERCFIVATGPSLRVEDLNTLYLNHETCISVNGIFSIFDKTAWRPDYYTVSDQFAASKWRKEILESQIKEKFVSDVSWNKSENLPENMHIYHLQMKREGEDEIKFSDDFAKVAYDGTTVTYNGALQLAFYMGFKKIYLTGVDCCNYESKEKQHFDKNYNDEREELNLEGNIKAYMSAKEYAKKVGVEIYNATRGGKLEVFERVNFDKLFE